MGACAMPGQPIDMPAEDVSLDPAAVDFTRSIGRQEFIRNQKGDIRNVYDVEGKTIGAGAFGVVSKGRHKITKAVRAVKIISAGPRVNYEDLVQEIDIMKRLDHPNIINLFESFEDPKNVYLVMELCDGGQLSSHLSGRGHLAEDKAAIVMEQVLRGVFYMHSNGVVHRDLKPDNFLFKYNHNIDTNNVLKIIDFGIACLCKPGDVLTQRCGTTYYAAPQVFRGRYDNKCDLWSCGVIMYLVLSGDQPFYGRRQAAVIDKVVHGTWSFTNATWGRVSKSAKDLVGLLLEPRPATRPTAEEALGNEWFRRPIHKSVKASLQTSIVENISSFRSEGALKKTALEIIARQLEEKDINGIRDFFTSLDTNKDGLLTAEELGRGLEQSGLHKTQSELEQIVSSLDMDGNGVIDYTEFLAASLDPKKYLAGPVCWKAFNVLDADGDGRISQEELEHVLDPESIKEDGIDFEEFMAVMRTGSIVKEGRGRWSRRLPRWSKTASTASA